MLMKMLRVNEFKKIMLRIAEAWSRGVPSMAIDHYTEEALFEFCGNMRPRSPIRMTWHHLSFDERQQIGMGEYTFQQMSVGEYTVLPIRKYHGIAWIQMRDGKITAWRELRY